MAGRATREASPYRADSERLREALRAARLNQALSQQELATQAKVAIGTVRAIETGRVVEPGFFTVLALAAALGMDVNSVIAAGSASQQNRDMTRPDPGNQEPPSALPT